jgi:hypothetical protein
MQAITIIGLDIAKSVLQVHGIDSIDPRERCTFDGSLLGFRRGGGINSKRSSG